MSDKSPMDSSSEQKFEKEARVMNNGDDVAAAYANKLEGENAYT